MIDDGEMTETGFAGAATAVGSGLFSGDSFSISVVDTTMGSCSTDVPSGTDLVGFGSALVECSGEVPTGLGLWSGLIACSLEVSVSSCLGVPSLAGFTSEEEGVGLSLADSLSTGCTVSSFFSGLETSSLASSSRTRIAPGKYSNAGSCPSSSSSMKYVSLIPSPFT